MKKVLFSAALTLCLLLGINTMTMAAACTCGNNRPHDSGSHNTYCENTGNAQGHQVFCYTCQVNGHDATCAQVDLGIKAHSWGNPEGIGTSRKHSCTECGYTEKLSCNHAQTNWNNNGDGTCSQYCRDCQSVLTTKSHDIKYTVSSVSETELHYADCTRCSYSKTEYHVWKTTYTPYPTPKNPIMKSKNVLTWPTRDHKTVHTCKLCGESWEEKLNTITLPGKGHLYEHKWRNNKCTRCGLKRDILPTVKSLKGKQLGSGTKATVKTKAYWAWTGKRFKYYPAGTYDLYGYKVQISYKKNSKAAGYVYSLEKPKKGSYVNQIGGASTNYMYTKKTTIDYAISSFKRISSINVWIAPVSKYGFIGTPKKVKIPLN